MHPRSRLASGAVVVLLVVLIGCGKPATNAQDHLIETDWQFVSIGHDGRAPYEVKNTDFRVVRFDGDGNFSTDGCNSTSGRVKVDSANLRFEDDRSSTLVGCQGEAATLDSLVWRLLSQSVGWSRVDDELSLKGNGITAKLRPRIPPWPTLNLNVLIEEDQSPGGPQFQVGWIQLDEGQWLEYHGREARGISWGRAGLAVGPYYFGPALDAVQYLTLGERAVVFGQTPLESVSAEFQSPGVAPVALQVSELPGGAKVFAGLLSSHLQGAVVAKGSDGSEVGRSRIQSSKPVV